MDFGVLARSYNPLYYNSQLKSILINFYKNENFEDFSKKDLHIRINNTLFKNYKGEEILKYRLANYYKNKDYVAAFEVKAKTSRADFLVINGSTRCFEIKSKIDTLYRLKKQAIDYGDVFEYNTVVIDKKHLDAVCEIIPEYYGIWCFNGSKKVSFREAAMSPFLNENSQIGLFTKKELNKYFGIACKETVLKKHTGFDINLQLKQALKDRYKNRWSFVTKNWDKILPIDLQFFYNTNVCPDLIYNS